MRANSVPIETDFLVMIVSYFLDRKIIMRQIMQSQVNIPMMIKGTISTRLFVSLRIHLCVLSL